MRDLLYKIRWFFLYKLKFRIPRDFILRGIRGYAPTDLWCFYCYLGKIITNGLKDLKEIQHGYPTEFDNYEEWEEIIDEMIAGFETAEDDVSYAPMDSMEQARDFGVVESYENYKKLQRALRLFQKYYLALWD